MSYSVDREWDWLITNKLPTTCKALGFLRELQFKCPILGFTDSMKKLIFTNQSDKNQKTTKVNLSYHKKIVSQFLLQSDLGGWGSKTWGKKVKSLRSLEVVGLTLQLKMLFVRWTSVSGQTQTVIPLAFQIIGRADLAEAIGCPTNCDLQRAGRWYLTPVLILIIMCTAKRSPTFLSCMLLQKLVKHLTGLETPITFY